MTSHEITNFVDILEKAHEDNAQYQYYAKRERQTKLRPTMPVTPFVFEFFLYNSIYQVDWEESIRMGVLQNHSRDLSDSQCQRRLEKFLKSHGRMSPNLVHEAFLPLMALELSGDWLAINPDSRISVEQGQRFFRELEKIRRAISTAKKPEELSISSRLFDSIEACRYYIYLVRNNIFHGSKTLGETYEKDQRRRIEVYLLFLRSLTRLFFLVFKSLHHVERYA